MAKLTPPQVAVLRLVASGAVSYMDTGSRSRYAIRTETINRGTVHALSRRGLIEREPSDRFWRQRVVLTAAGREALAEAPAEEPKETP